MREAIVKKLLAGGLAVNDGITTTGTEGPVAIDTPIANATFYVLALSGSTTGKVTIEEAHSINYANTWIAVGVVTCATAGLLQVVRVQNTEALAYRARVTQTANGSGIDVIMKAS